MSFAVQLAPHEEVALLLEVEVAVGTHEALWMPVLIPGLHNRPAGEKKESKSKMQRPNPATEVTGPDKAGGVCFTLGKPSLQLHKGHSGDTDAIVREVEDGHINHRG